MILIEMSQASKLTVVLSTLKLRHAKVMTDMYQNLKSGKGKEVIKAGWRAAGIIVILKDAREGNWKLLFLLRIHCI